ncbi:MAG: hypothetical protein RLZZ502_1048, partial [Pseudomonadota bacterium]
MFVIFTMPWVSSQPVEGHLYVLMANLV